MSGAAGRLARVGIVLAGVAAISTASVLIRLADAPALAVGAWRLCLATLALAPWGAPKAARALGATGRRGRRALLIGAAAVALAGHFAAWIASLRFTTVASSVVLVTTTPIYVAVASRLFLGEAISRRRVLAIAVAMAGSVAIGFGDVSLSGTALLGDALAVLGAVAMAAHLMVGRVARQELDTFAYVWPTYGLAGLLLALLCLLSGQPLLGYPAATYTVLLLLALVPQVLGHTIVNWALAHVSPLLVTLAILGEPIGASALALLVLREAPPLAVWFGGPAILIGIYLASREEAIGARAVGGVRGAQGAPHPTATAQQGDTP